MRSWLEAETGALESGDWVLALLHVDCVAITSKLAVDFTHHSDFMLLGADTKSHCKGFGVGHSGASSHLRSLNAHIVWRINDSNNQCA